MSNSIKENLLVRTILSPSFNFEDSTASGELNKQALVNRVQKLKQKDRVALNTELQFMSQLVNSSAGIQSAALKEKGLSALLLIDDGLPAKTHHFFKDLFHRLMHFLGQRVGSDEIVNQMCTLRKDLISKQRLTALDHDIDLAEVPSILQFREFQLQHSQERPERIQHLEFAQDKLYQLSEKFQELSLKFLPKDQQPFVPSPAEFMDIFEDINQLQEFVKKNHIALTVKSTDQLHAMHQLSRAFVHSSSMAEIAEYLIRNFQFNPEDMKDAEMLAKIRNGNTPIDEDQEKSYWIYNLLIPTAHSIIRKVYFELDHAINSSKSEKMKIEEEIDVIQTRLDKFKKDCEVQAKRRTLEKSEAKLQILDSSLNAYTKILSSVDELNKQCNLSIAALRQLVDETGLSLTLLSNQEMRESLISATPPRTFSQCLSHLAHIVHGDFSTLGDLKKSIQIEVYREALDERIYQRLKQFVVNAQAYPLNTKDFASDYIAYLKVVALSNIKKISAERKEILQTIGESEKQIQSLVVSIKEKPSVFPEPIKPAVPSFPTFSIPFIAPQSNSPIPQSERQKLIGLTAAVQQGREKENIAKHYYLQVKGISPEVRESVYENLYFVMRDANEMLEEDLNWGGIVFEGASEASVKRKPMTPAKMNHYRVQAMLKTIYS